jgi:hypothetical protein
MMKSFKSNAWMLPQPVLITYAPVHHNYIKLGSIEGKAFADGKQIG